MENNKNTILVPWDFSETADFALQHAVQIADVVDNEIMLLHITNSTKKIQENQVKLDNVAAEAKSKYNKEVKGMVKEGSIFTTIGEVSSKIANLVIMGTHGIKGTQKIFGSWALKVIAHSKEPFIVVQAPPATEKFDKILFPIDFRRENKESIAWVSYLYKYYKTKFHLFKANITDIGLKQSINNNLLFAKRILVERGIEHEIITASGKKSFEDEILDYAKEVQADLILIMTTKNPTLQDYMFGATEQQLIANKAKIPIMCINPKEELHKSRGFS